MVSEIKPSSLDFGVNEVSVILRLLRNFWNSMWRWHSGSCTHT